MNPHEDFERGSVPSFNMNSPFSFNWTFNVNSPLSFDWNSPTAFIGSSPTAFSNSFAPHFNSPPPESAFGAQPAHVPRDQSSWSIPASTTLQVEDAGEGSSSAAEHDQSFEMNAPPQPAMLQRTKYRGLDWDAHKNQIKSLYLEGQKNLQETMEIMKDQHDFDASKKLYKEKFKQWGWQKNLPGDYAQWMAVKANMRETQAGKDTDFLYGGLRWTRERVQSRANRARKGDVSADAVYIDTPAGVTYETPQETHTPPMDGSAEAMEGVVTVLSPCPPEIASESDKDDDVDDVAHLALSFEGLSRTDLIAKFAAAKSTMSRGDTETAEQMFVGVLAGYEHLLGSVHDDTNKVTYALASFYAETNRVDEADKLIEKMTQKILDRFGVEGRTSQQHILHVVELLDTWNRPVDALAFLSRAKDIYAAASEHHDDSTGRKAKTRKRRRRSSQASKISNTQIQEITASITNHADPAMIIHGIGVARSHVAVKDESVAALLKAIIKQCDRKALDSVVEGLEARNELLKLYTKLGTVQENKGAFLEAIHTLQFILDQVNFDAETFKSFEIMEACLKIAVCLLKGQFHSEAQSIFRKIEEKSADIFGSEDERTIWVLLSIGLVYQTQTGWDAARPWFDQAYSFALAAYDNTDGILKSLEAARERKYFTYLSDEGRPFKTIFGVSGITIRPGRLHLE
ncbi:hypothetical protein ONS95_014264 [Cadophora gregata]|uniref:uncharacterized protein n=1 Tax=Cadophora gregata TaxID=51156 RepID=UPI0026DABDE5|nr:uncharacterized protein ONS95_014264 [Cadophora gregata]KAK0114782.1 hypothetical protein ONS95_014264 [Cadophora gregata]